MIDLEQFEGHTPGPWYVREAELRRAVAPVVCAKHAPLPGMPEDEREIARVLYYIGSEDREVRPNARLMAAAPALLAEVKRLREALRDLGAASWRFMYAMGRDVHPAYDALKEMITDLAIDGDVDRGATIDALRRKRTEEAEANAPR